MSAPLLVELLCEELPPKALAKLGAAFAFGLRDGLARRGLVAAASEPLVFATPRRLAMGLREVCAASASRELEVKLMPVSIALDASGKPTTALEKKLQALGLAGIDAARFKRRQDGKAEALFVDTMTPSTPLAQALQEALDETLAQLPIPKLMSYQLADGVTTVHFVRPAHGLVALHGSDIVAVRALGLAAGRTTRGHRFQGARQVEITRADDYERALGEEGGVIASFTNRRADVLAQLEAQAKSLGGNLGESGSYEPLLDEVTALVEKPTVYAGTFEPAFLDVPGECLTLTMRQNQKYFPLFDAQGGLTNRFLIVSNMRLADPVNIVQGNERVVRPRLADARFFYDTDRKTRLAERVPQLATIVHHNKLGSQLERVERLRTLATRIQEWLPRGAQGKEWADRAALLAKADLVTLMVGEFPELQGTMGRYYAQADGEQPSVVRAIEQHYWPRFAGDKLPSGDTSVAVALADKMETLAGLFGLGQQPTGDKDPFGARRAALGVIRILVEGGYDIDLHELVNAAFAVFPPNLLGKAQADLETYIFERMRGYLRERGFTANEAEAVLCMNPMRLKEIPKQLEAVRAFSALPESASLAAANKRVDNILRKAAGKGHSFVKADRAVLREPAELALFDALSEASRTAQAVFEQGDYTGYLKTFAVLKAPVDEFFDKVMVMADDPALRENRLALLQDLRNEMNRIADLSKLAT